MKITPLPSAANTILNNGGVEIRSMKIATNATPPGHEAVQAQVEDLPRPLTNNDEKINKEVEEATQPLSPQYAALARQRRAIQQEKQALDRAKAEWATKSKDVVDLATLKSKPLSVLLENGVTYDQLTQEILANQGGSEIQALKAEIKALNEGVDRKFSERDAQQEQQVLADMRREAVLLAKQGDTFELVRETKSIPDVMRLIERTYRETGEVLDVSDALELVESELVKESLKLAKFKKVQGQLSPQPIQQPQPPQRQMRTLTNKDTASAPMSARARALAAFYGNKR